MSPLHRALRTIVLGGLTVAAVGCDYDGDFLFPQPSENVPGIIDLGTLTPDTLSEEPTLEELRDLVKYGEVGATGTAAIGGLSFQFRGTGRDMCIFVDPETVSWSQSVARQSPVQGFRWPDNLIDDGDLDLYAGVSVYYSGSPGVEIGGFEVRYQDSLGNEIPVEFNECVIEAPDYRGGGAHSGRAMPEYCTLGSTQTDVDYTVVLETWSPPGDDNRLGYGLLFVEAPCSTVEALIQENTLDSSECLILGESINPIVVDNAEHDYREQPFLGTGPATADQFAWEESTTIEQLFCNVYANTADDGLVRYCEEEDERLQARSDCEREGVRCYCGDFAETPPADF